MCLRSARVDVEARLGDRASERASGGEERWAAKENGSVKEISPPEGEGKQERVKRDVVD